MQSDLLLCKCLGPAVGSVIALSLDLVCRYVEMALECGIKCRKEMQERTWPLEGAEVP